MGIKGLWNVLAPYSEKKSLHEVRGETIAVDLSGWVCDSQNVTDYYVQPKLYLRNLFFRTIYLLLADINPIFVLEGDAPELKRDVMAARNAIQFRGAAPRSEIACSNKRPDVGRRRFKVVLKECESLLKCMGVRCVKGNGEAEATCAQLNAQGVCIQDILLSTQWCRKTLIASRMAPVGCIATSAFRVRRAAAPLLAPWTAMTLMLCSAAMGYDSSEMSEECTGFGRNKMVALALLCGCDYGVGACGSSISTVVSFLHTVPEKDVIPRLLSWVTDVDHYEERTRWIGIPGRCDRCGHGGRTHLKNGCPVCVTHKGCNDTGHKAKVAEVKRELSLRGRALSCGMPFPEPRVMKEFMNTAIDNIDLDPLKNPAPNLIQFVKLMSNKLDWAERYCVVKFLPLLTKWHLQEHVPLRTIKPVKIIKKRIPRGVPSFEVVWSDIDGEYEALISDDQFEDGEDRSVPWTTTERQDLMRQYYPQVVEAFEEATKKPLKEKKTRKKKTGADNDKTNKPKTKYNKKVAKVKEIDLIDNLSASMNNISLTNDAKDNNVSKDNVSISVNKLKRKLKTKVKSKGQRTLDSFMRNKRRKSSIKSIENLRHSFRNMSITLNNSSNGNNDLENKAEMTCKHLLSMLDSSEREVDESDLSDIVDKIISSAPVRQTAKVDNRLYKLVFDKYSTPKKSIRKTVLSEIQNNCSTPRDSPIRRHSYKFTANISNNSIASCRGNTSYFFDIVTEDRDAFEISMDYKHKSAIINLDSDTTEDYSLPDVHL